jgi:hypothetical protein
MDGSSRQPDRERHQRRRKSRWSARTAGISRGSPPWLCSREWRRWVRLSANALRLSSGVISVAACRASAVQHALSGAAIAFLVALLKDASGCWNGTWLHFALRIKARLLSQERTSRWCRPNARVMTSRARSCTGSACSGWPRFKSNMARLFRSVPT